MYSQQEDIGYDHSDPERRILQFKWILLFVDAFVFFLGLAIFGVCLWIRFDLDFREWVWEMQWYTFWYCTFVVMTAMIIVVPTTVLHLYGILVQSTSCIFWTHWIYALCIVIEFIGCVCILVYGVEESHVLTNQLRDVFLELVYRSDYDPRAMRILKIIQEYVGCCGAHGAEDYINALKPMPWECRDPVTGREYGYGCMQQLAWYIEPWSATLGAACISLILIHVAQIIIGRKLNRKLVALEYDYEYY